MTFPSKLFSKNSGKLFVLRIRQERYCIHDVLIAFFHFDIQHLLELNKKKQKEFVCTIVYENTQTYKFCPYVCNNPKYESRYDEMFGLHV